MDDRQDARHSIEDARQRLNQLTDELAQRVNPQRLKEEAKQRGRMLVTEARDRAGDTVRRTEQAAGAQVRQHPAGAAGALAGFVSLAVGATLLARRRRARREELLRRALAEQRAESARMLADDIALAVKERAGTGSRAVLRGVGLIRRQLPRSVSHTGERLVDWLGERSARDLVLIAALGLGLGTLLAVPLLGRRAGRRARWVSESGTPRGGTARRY